MNERTRVINRVFWSAYNRYWSNLELTGDTPETIAATVEKLVANGAKSGQHVLDAGCGTGIYTLALAGAGFQATGVDFARGVLEQARHKAAQQNLPADFEKMDLDGHFWFADGYFDHAICLGVFNLLNRPEWALQEFHRVIKPGGLLLCSLWLNPDMYREAYPEIFRQLIRGQNPNVKERAMRAARNLGERRIHLRFWTAGEFGDLLAKAGFEPLELEGSPVLLALARRA